MRLGFLIMTTLFALQGSWATSATHKATGFEVVEVSTSAIGLAVNAQRPSGHTASWSLNELLTCESANAYGYRIAPTILEPAAKIVTPTSGYFWMMY